MNNLLNVFKNFNVSNVIASTNKTLKTVKKVIPVYKEVKPFLSKEKKIFNDNINIAKKESEPQYNDSLTFFN